APERALTQAAQAQARTIEEEIFEFLGQGEVPAASTAAPSGLAPRGPDPRRLEAVRESVNAWQGKAYEEELLKDESPGGALAREALDAYARKENLKAVLHAQAALGEDPSHEARRVLLSALSRLTGIETDPEGVLPLAALIHHELKLAEAAFFDQRYGAAIQACRRALLLDPKSSKAWERLGSAQYALGQSEDAREAYLHALELDPDDPALRSFMIEKGWLAQ
ncbi:MAG: tetratricopeptide repeat protein, partial [Elusimicrobia bacterium]|nr:tetratricopeptide repeat protein [Elusimicrobiota bacterium]